MADRAERVGQQIGDYHLLRRLGGGGFGDVYLGAHIRTQDQAAVKVLQTRLTRSDELKEFINEARTFRLRHPHIVQLLDFGIASDDVPYLVMEYAVNGTLRDKHLKGTRVPLPTILSYVTQLASALQYAHDQHLIHRDVKPENMLLDVRSEVLLTDFGIAAVAHSSRSLNTQEGIGGTLPYMAPEQIAGKPRPASDQYALGIVVYEWLTGTRPFKGTTVEIAMQHSMTPPQSLRDQVPLLSAEVEQVVLTALAKEPKERFASITAFARALEQAGEEPETLLRATPPPPALRTSLSPAVAKPPVAMPPQPVAEPVKGEASLDVEHVSTNRPLHPIPSQPASSPYTRKITEAVSAAVIPPPVPLPRTPPPVSVPLPDKKRSIRPRALFLIGLAALIIISGSITWATIATQTATRNTATRNADAIAAADAYNHGVAARGTMFGFDAQHTRYNPFERILSPTTVSGLKTAWTSEPTGSSISSSPAIANGVVYVGSNDHKLYAYKAEGCGDGKSPCPPLWSSDPTGDVITSSPAVANGVVYVGSDQKLYAYKAEGCGKSTCPPLWSSDPTGGAIWSSPAVANGMVYVGSQDYKLYAYKADGCGNGKSTCSPLWSSDPTGGVITSSPAVANGVVYVGSYDHKLYAYKADGCGKSPCSPLWSSDPTGDSISSSPAVANGVVYVGSQDYKLYAYKAEGCGKSPCSPLWSSYFTGNIISSSPSVANGVIYVGSDQKLYAFHL